jgi:hypothetical protein
MSNWHNPGRPATDRGDVLGQVPEAMKVHAADLCRLSTALYGLSLIVEGCADPYSEPEPHLTDMQ